MVFHARFDRKIWSVAVSAFVISSIASVCCAQSSTTGQSAKVAEFIVGGSLGHDAFSLSIDVIGWTPARTESDVGNGSWLVTKTFASGPVLTIGGTGCPAAKDAILALRHLTPIAVTPRETLIYPVTGPIGPSRKDGWKIESFELALANIDGTGAAVTFKSATGEIDQWANDTVSALYQCFEMRLVFQPVLK